MSKRWHKIKGEGVCFSIPHKSEMASLSNNAWQPPILLPLLNWERPYRGEICNELNIECYCLRKDATIGFFHPIGTHDDVIWRIALSVYTTAQMAPEPYLTIIPR